MAFSANMIAVGSDSILLLATNTNQKKRVITNLSSNDLYIGSDAAVSSTNGFPIGPSDEFLFNDYNGDVYGMFNVVGSDTYTVQVLEDD